MRHWFERSYGKVAAVLYASGVLLHVLHLRDPGGGVAGFPFWYDAVALGLGGYALIGFKRYDQDHCRGGWLGVLHDVIMVHLVVTVVIHGASLLRGDHVFLAPFDTVWYSWVAVFAYSGFVVYGWVAGWPTSVRRPLADRRAAEKENE